MTIRHGKGRGRWGMRVALVVGVFAALTAPAAQKRSATPVKARPSAGMYLVQAGDKFDLSAGTLAVRFRLNYSLDDYLAPELSGYAAFPFLHVGSGRDPLNVDPDAPYMTVSIRQGRGENFFHLVTNTYALRRKGTADDFRTGGLSVYASREKGPWLERGEPHEFVLTWKTTGEGLHLDMYLDGKPVGSRVLNERMTSIPAFPKDAFLSIGSTQLSAATLLAYRLLKRALTREEVSAKVSPDEGFIFDDATVGKAQKLSLVEFSAMSKGRKIDCRRGVFIGDYRIVTTAEGKGVQFSK